MQSKYVMIIKEFKIGRDFYGFLCYLYFLWIIYDADIYIYIYIWALARCIPSDFDKRGYQYLPEALFRLKNTFPMAGMDPPGRGG